MHFTLGQVLAIVSVFGGALSALFWWLVRRHVADVDQLKLDMALRPTEEEIRLNMQPLVDAIKALQQDGKEREGRILGEFRAAHTENRSEMSSLRREAREDMQGVRADVGALHRRVDAVLAVPRVPPGFPVVG